jgi:hypothetical protein
MSERKQSPAPVNDDTAVSPLGKLPSLSQRLPSMTDHQLRAYQSSAERISREPEHPKHATAILAIPKIEAEIRRRTAKLATPE